MMDPNLFQQNFQMFMQQNPQFMMNNPNMMGMNNPNMMGMNNPNMMGFNNPGMMGMNNMFYPQNQQFQQPNDNPGAVNLVFQNRINPNKIIIQANINESVSSVINKYISKSGDYHINLYIYNGKKLNESLTLAESGIVNNCNINVVELDELEGA